METNSFQNLMNILVTLLPYAFFIVTVMYSSKLNTNWMFVLPPPQIHMLEPNPQRNSIWRLGPLGSD